MEKNDHDRIIEIEREMAAHETMCEERWKTTFHRLEDIDSKLDRMEARQLQMGGAIILFLAGVIVTLAL